MKTLARSLPQTILQWNLHLLAVAAVALALCAPAAVAQSGAGSIQGTVTDSTGAVIPGALIHVVNQGTNVASDAKSNGVGFYQVPELFTGTYTVTVTAPGMKSYKTSIELQVAQSAEINPAMSTGAVTQQVEVAADTVQLTTTDNGTIASTLEASRINQLPMNGRTLITLAGEATPGLESNGTRANGLMGEALEYVADGVTLSNRQFGGMNLAQTQAPDPDSVQEVRVETTNTSAQYSEPGTAIITTKSGTNSLHGSAFETARNNGIGIAKNRNNLASFVAPHLVRNEFGASAGGPIILPHVYHGKDKSFWFFAYERYSLANPSNEIVDVPNTQERNGDFSWYTNSSGVYQQLYDPNTTQASANCNGTGVANQYCRAPLGNGTLGDPGNNQIASSRLSPTMKIIYDITPLPTNSNNPMLAQNAGNSAAAGSILNGNLTAINPTFVVVPTITFRLDHEFNENNRAYLRYTNNNLTNISLRNYTNTNLNNPTTLKADGLPAEATGVAINPSSQFAAALGYTHVFSPNFFNELIVSQQWMAQHNFAGGTPFADLEKVLGTPNNFGEGGFPSIGSGQLLNQLWGYGGTQFIYGISQIVANIDDNITYTHGKHQFQFGGRYRHEHFGWLPDESADNISFGGLGTSLSLNGTTTPAPNTGGDDPDAYLGNVSSYSVTQEPPYSKFHDMEIDGYFQDNWRVGRTLTVNLGFRWEDHPATYTAAGTYNSFDLKNDAMVLQVSPATLIQRGYTTQAIITNMMNNGAKYETPQQAGWPSTLMRNYPFNFSPRVGIAWQPLGAKRGTVIRGAYGRYIYPMPTRSFIKNPMGNNPLVASYSQNFDNSNQTDGIANAQLRYGQNGTQTWSQTGTTMSGFLPVMGANSTNNVNSASINSITPGVAPWSNSQSVPPDFVTQMNFTIEQPLKGNAALRVTYLWDHATNLDHYFYYNNTTASSSQQFLWDMTQDTAASSANSYISTRPYDTTTWGNSTWDVKDGWSNDNALQVNYQRLFHHGIAYQVAYVWSKAFRLGGNYFRDGTVYPAANFLGVLPIAAGTSYTAANAGGVITAPSLPPAAPTGTLPWQEYHKLIYWQEYKPDTAIPFHHITFNGIVDLPFGRGKRYLGSVNKWEDEAVGGWQIAGAGQVVSQTFAPTYSNWGATNKFKLYKNGVTVTDCTGVCQKRKLWYNGFILPTAAQMGKITGLPSGYVVGQASSPAYESPINPIAGNNNVNVVGPTGTFNNIAFTPSPSNFGDNPYSRTILNGPFNYNVDLSVFKVFPISEKAALRFNADAFNALNIQGYTNPNTTTGEIAYQPNGLSSSYWTPRQIQLTLRLEF
ncbi:MAG: carboxypeptidase-like regulatory domain-containing protein [Terracidiphilus sp.]|jgi:hypothetical protein